MRSDKRSSSTQVIALGLGLVAVSIVAIVGAQVMGLEPTTGRASTLIAVGVPLGIVIAVVGIVSKVRERR